MTARRWARGRPALDDVPAAVARRRSPAPARRARRRRRRPRAAARPRPPSTVAAGLGGPPEATAARPRRRGSARRPPRSATGTLVHALDFDDTHAGGLVHATAVVLPAALAVGEQVGADRRRGAASPPWSATRPSAGSPPPPRTRSTPAACTPPRSAASSPPPLVAARLMGSTRATDRRRARHRRQPGRRACWSSSPPARRPSSCTPGWPSQAGILAARLAAAGADGPDTVLEGAHGLSTPRWPTGAADPARRCAADLGDRWETHPDQASSRTRPASSCTPPSTPAARAAAGRRRRAGRHRVVEAEVHPDSAADRLRARTRSSPRTAYDAKFSLPWSVAALLVDGERHASTPTTGAGSPGRRWSRWPAGSRSARWHDPRVAADAAGPGRRWRSPTARCSSARCRAARAGRTDPLRCRGVPTPSWPPTSAIASRADALAAAVEALPDAADLTSTGLVAEAWPAPSPRRCPHDRAAARGALTPTDVPAERGLDAAAARRRPGRLHVVVESLPRRRRLTAPTVAHRPVGDGDGRAADGPAGRRHRRGRAPGRLRRRSTLVPRPRPAAAGEPGLSLDARGARRTTTRTPATRDVYRARPHREREGPARRRRRLPGRRRHPDVAPAPRPAPWSRSTSPRRGTR